MNKEEIFKKAAEEGRPLSAEEITGMMPDNVQKKYRVKGHKEHGLVPGLKFKKGKFGMVDFSNMTLEKAAGLVKEGFPYLEAIGKEDTADAKK